MYCIFTPGLASLAKLLTTGVSLTPSNRNIVSGF